MTPSVVVVVLILVLPPVLYSAYTSWRKRREAKLDEAAIAEFIGTIQ